MLSIIGLGALVGFLIALPTGPVGILCIRKTLIFGRRSGLVSVFGSVFADTFFSLVVIFSLTFILSFFTQYALLLQIAGGFLFLFIAWRAQKLVINEDAITIPSKTLLGDFIETFTLTFTNPTFIFSLSFIFSLFHIQNYAPTFTTKVIFLGGIALGALSWWIGFVFVADHIHRKRHAISLRVINKVSAYILGIVGVFFLVLAVIKIFHLF